MDQDKITEKVKEGALPEFQQRIPQEAAEETQERIAVEKAQRNADLRSKYLIGNDTAAVRDFLIRQLSMKSRPEAIFVGGRFEWRGAPDQHGADTPQPPKLASTFDPGVTADLHLGSLATSAASGALAAGEGALGPEPDDRDQGRAARHAAQGRGQRQARTSRSPTI